MPTPTPTTVVLWIRPPLTRADLPGLYERVCEELRASGAELAICDVTGVEADAVAVDALARLRLGARRAQCRVQLRNASRELVTLLAFVGLFNVVDS